MAGRYKRSVLAARYVHSRGRHTRRWYAGVTDNPEARLFDEHGVHPTQGEYAWAECRNDDVARDAEAMLLDAGYQGGTGGGGRKTRFVYVYKTTRTTRE